MSILRVPEQVAYRKYAGDSTSAVRPCVRIGVGDDEANYSAKNAIQKANELGLVSKSDQE